MRARNYTKSFSIAGLILGEFIMLYTVLAPKRQGPPIHINVPMEASTLPPDTATPAGALILELAVSSIYFALFGALVGLGIGLLVTGLLQKRQPPANGPRPQGVP